MASKSNRSGGRRGNGLYGKGIPDRSSPFSGFAAAMLSCGRDGFLQPGRVSLRAGSRSDCGQPQMAVLSEHGADPDCGSKQNAGEHAEQGRKQDGGQGPAEASRFFPDGQAGGGAGPVHQGEENHGNGSGPGPAIGGQEPEQLGGAAGFHQTSGGQIAHEDNGHDNLIGREAQKEGKQDHAVQSHQPSQGIQEGGTPLEQRFPAQPQIGGQPDDQAGGNGDHDGPSKDK